MRRSRKVSQLFHVDRIQAPLLIGQGANDPRCKMQESDQIVKAIRERGLHVDYVVYADEGHGFVRPENKLDFNGRVEDFFSRHLGAGRSPSRRQRDLRQKQNRRIGIPVSEPIFRAILSGTRQPLIDSARHIECLLSFPHLKEENESISR